MKFLSTPYLCLDLNILKKNINLMKTIAHKSNLKLIPHAKTHKCAEITKLFIKSGADGIIRNTKVNFFKLFFLLENFSFSVAK